MGRMCASNCNSPSASMTISIPDENEAMPTGISLPTGTTEPQLDALAGSLQVLASGGYSEQEVKDFIEWVASSGVSSHESNDEAEYDDLRNRAKELIQRIESCERKTPVQAQKLYEEIVTFIKDDGEKHIFLIPVEFLTLLEWMSFILNFRDTCVNAIQYLKE